jgi:hypothetical protein
MALSQKDLKEIKSIVKDTIIENNIVLEQELSSKFDMKLEEKIKHLPSKDEFYIQMDKIMKELKDIREELAITSHRSIDNTDRIEKIEGKVFKN